MKPRSTISLAPIQKEKEKKKKADTNVQEFDDGI